MERWRSWRWRPCRCSAPWPWRRRGMRQFQQLEQFAAVVELEQLHPVDVGDELVGEQIPPSPRWCRLRSSPRARSRSRPTPATRPTSSSRSDGQTVVGMDADLVKALGRRLGLKVNVVNADLRHDHPGPGRGQIRPRSVLVHGHQGAREDRRLRRLLRRRGRRSSPRPPAARRSRDSRDLCGKSVSVEKRNDRGDAMPRLRARSATRPASRSRDRAGVPDQNGANLALSSGRAQLGMADSPVAAYQVKKSNGAFKLIGSLIATAPYGLAVPKSNGMAQAVLAALKVLMKNGHVQPRSSPSGGSRLARSGVAGQDQRRH